jgi:hypothetical protein
VLDLLRGVYPAMRQREPEGQVEGPRINTTVTATGTITTITT